MSVDEASPAPALAPDVAGRARGRVTLVRVIVAIGFVLWIAAQVVLEARSASLPEGERLVGAPGGPPALAAALALLAWALLVATAREAASALHPRLARFAPGVVVAVAVWQHQLRGEARPWWYPDFAPVPFGGTPWLPWSPPALVAWRLGWTVLEVALILGLAQVLRARARPAARAPRASAGHRNIAAAAVCLATVTVATAYSAGVIDDRWATIRGAVDFLLGNALIIGVAVVAGVAAPGRRGLSIGLLAAVGLNIVTVWLDGGSGSSTRPQLLALPSRAYNDDPAMTVLPLVLAAGLAVMWATLLHSLARGLARLQDRPSSALVFGLVLNTVDAVATGAGISAGVVEEANPLVEQMGLGAKWVFVSLLLLGLWRLRPHLVWVVTVAYALVAAYHVLGATVLV